MKKYIVSMFAALLSTACLSGSVESDVSLSHTFQLPIELSVTGAPTFAQDCYQPNVGNTFRKLSNESSDFSWKISSLKDNVSFGSEADSVSLSKLTLTLLSGDDSIILNSPANMSPQAQSVELIDPTVDSAALQRILTSDAMQVCLAASGSASINSIVGVQNSITFNLQINIDKSL